MDANQLTARARNAVLAVIAFLESEKCRTQSGDVITRQLIRSATSVAANYRAACRAKSPRDFVYKMSIIVEEADESVFWLEMLRDARLLPVHILAPLIDEYGQLLRIFSASRKTAKEALKRMS